MKSIYHLCVHKRVNLSIVESVSDGLQQEISINFSNNFLQGPNSFDQNEEGPNAEQPPPPITKEWVCRDVEKWGDFVCVRQLKISYH